MLIDISKLEKKLAIHSVNDKNKYVSVHARVWANTVYVGEWE